MEAGNATVTVPIEWLEGLIRESERFRIQLAMDSRLKSGQHPGIGGERKYQNYTKAIETPEKEPEKDEKAVEITTNNSKPGENDAKQQETGDEKARKTRAKEIDDGKIRALFRGKWRIKDIADEMGINQQTVRNHLKAMGETETAKGESE